MKIHTIDLKYRDRAQAIAAYLIAGPDGPVLVETGPQSTLETLLAGLADCGYTPADIRHVLVTHIHLDHAGAAGWWAQQGSQIYVHPRGAPHLVDPSKLLASAHRIYGDRMESLWGVTRPAPAERVTVVHDGDAITAGGLTFIALDTPGHASHHHVFRLGEVAFIGDAAGVRLPHSRLVSLPAPPPEFDLEAWHRTIARLLQEDFGTIYPTHFGAVEDVREHLEALTSLLSQSAEFVRTRMVAKMRRDELVQEYVSWSLERAKAAQTPVDVSDKYEISNPNYMSVDGIMRYWRKRWESENRQSR